MVQPLPLPGRPQYAAPFIGRETELDEITGLLRNPACHLLTLIGLGGVGKTRLAVEAAAQMVDDFPDGIFFVALQPLQSPDQIVMAVVTGLGLQPSDQDPRESLLTYLAHKHLLLVLDNFEHLLDGVDLLTEIFTTAPQVKLLVTSRHSLRLQEEWLLQVPGLDYPHEAATDPLEDYSAVQLFLERARRLRRDVDFNAHYDYIVHICQLVEGMPLALELAAGWIHSLSCQEIADEIASNLDILAARAQNTPKRHHSMEAVFDHSWQMLTEEERAVLPRFSVFRGGCTRESAQQITGATLPVLASLVEKSLLRHGADTGRYDIHEMLRQYAAAQLEQSEEADGIGDAHSQYFAATFHERERETEGPFQCVHWNAIGADLDNIRVAWAWALRRTDYEVIDKLVETIWCYFIHRSHAFEALALLARASQQLAASTSIKERIVLGRVLARQGKCENEYGHHDEAEALLRQSAALALAQDSLEDYHYALRWLALALNDQDAPGSEAEVRQMLGECITFYRQVGDAHKLALSLTNLSSVAYSLGQIAEGTHLCLESLSLFRQLGDAHHVAAHLWILGLIALMAGRWAEAETYLTEGLAQDRASQRLNTMMGLWTGLGWSAIAQGDFDQGRIHTEAANALWDEAFVPVKADTHLRARIDYQQALLADAQGAVADVAQLIGEASSWIEGGSHNHWADWFRDTAWSWLLCSLGQYDLAMQYLRWSLHFGLKRSGTGNLLWATATGARILAHQGRRIRAAELLGLIFTHPNSPRGYLEKHQGITQLRTDLETQLGADAYTDAWEHGAQLHIEQVARDLLHQFGEDDPMAQANQSLPDPLTPRELEVLVLLAEGLTNHDIADRLVISRGTVRSHLNHLYSKLAVENRVQAISMAQQRGLL